MKIRLNKVQKELNIGLDTAKSVLNTPREVLIEKADLEEDTVDHLIEVLQAEFEDEE